MFPDSRSPRDNYPLFIANVLIPPVGLKLITGHEVTTSRYIRNVIVFTKKLRAS